MKSGHKATIAAACAMAALLVQPASASDNSGAADQSRAADAAARPAVAPSGNASPLVPTTGVDLPDPTLTIGDAPTREATATGNRPALPAAPSAPAVAPTGGPANFLVLFQADGTATEHRSAIATANATAAQSYRHITGRLGAIRLAHASPAAIAAVSRAKGVSAVTRDARASIAAIPNDPYVAGAQQWWSATKSTYSGAANLASAWDYTTGSDSTVVAVVDSGSTNHPDLTGRWVAGYDFISGDTDATDPGKGTASMSTYWHGTRVASIIGANGNNSVGIAGAAWHGKIQPVRVIDGDGGWESDIVSGIIWAAGARVYPLAPNATPARIVNLSLEFANAPCDPVMQYAIDTAVSAGAIVISAAGNSSADASTTMPSSCDKVISVGANGRTGDAQSFNNWGSSVDLAAPGVDMYGATCNEDNTCATYGYSPMNGTSFAAPVVSGIAALAVSVAPHITWEQLQAVLQDTGSSLACPYFSPCGNVVVNAGTALQSLTSHIRIAPSSAVLTYPSHDGFNDHFTIDVLSPDAATINLDLYDASGVTKIGSFASGTPVASGAGYRATLGGELMSSPLYDSLPAGTYTLVATQFNGIGTDSDSIPLYLGSGRITTLTFAPDSDTIYPYPDGYYDTTTFRAYGVDETGTRLPLTGSIAVGEQVTQFAKEVNPSVVVGQGMAQRDYLAVAAMIGPSGIGYTSSSMVFFVRNTGIESLTLTASTPVVYPVRDGYYDTVTITAHAPSTTGDTMAAAGWIMVKQGSKIVARWRIRSTGDTTVAWNGKVARAIKAGKYRVYAVAKAGNGSTRSAARYVTVSLKKRVWYTKKSGWYSPRTAFDFCDGAGSYSCDEYLSSGARYYSNGAGDVVAAMNSLPFPVTASHVGYWRLWTSGWTTSATYWSLICADDTLDTCDPYDTGTQSYDGPMYEDQIWAGNWTRLGISNGGASWRMWSGDWGSMYVYGFRIEVKYWVLK